jgi:aminopeptidase N
MKGMKRWLALLLLLAFCAADAAHAAAAHLDLALTLDPETGRFQAQADLSTRAPLDLALDPRFVISRVSVNGVAVPAARLAAGRVALPARHSAGAPQRVRMVYSGQLPGLPTGGRGGSPDPGELFASPQGSFLDAGAGWYPDPGVPFSYRVRISLPAGQQAVAPGRQVRREEIGRQSVAEYRFDHPAEGIWVMAGPYQVTERPVLLDDGKPVMVRTWFPAELSDLADGYLQDSARYIQRYSRLIGDYPFGEFSIVASPLSHGLGIPSLTYLGRDVLRLPFIRATSLGHEVLHNWWGNGVYPQWEQGNWSEGLTTFLADYAFREDQSAEAAREMRLNWLRDLGAVAAADETSLADFRSRRHGISSVIGYGKSAMVFLMLRDEIGTPRFEDGLRRFWQHYRFRAASWKDLERTFTEVSGRDLSGFFAQWVSRASSPSLVLAPATSSQARVSFRLIQQGKVFDLSVPLRFRLASGDSYEMRLRVNQRETVVDPASAGVPAGARAVELDPDLRLWRRLERDAVPPILRETFIAPRSQVFVAGGDPAWTAPAMALAGRLLESPLQPVTEPQLIAAPDIPALVIGDRASVTALMSRLGLGGLPQVLLPEGAPASGEPPLKGTAQAWTARTAQGKILVLVIAGQPAQLDALQRAMPHYGRQSWLVFQDGRVVGQGAWPVAPQTLSLE